MTDIDAARKKLELIKKLPDTRMASYARVIVPALLNELMGLRVRLDMDVRCLRSEVKSLRERLDKANGALRAVYKDSWGQEGVEKIVEKYWREKEQAGG